jgi:hypothetical protein
MVQRQKAAKTIPDEEFYAAVDKALEEDRELLEKLAKV